MENNLTLRQFIEAREAEIKSLRADLLAELKELKAAKEAITLILAPGIRTRIVQ